MALVAGMLLASVISVTMSTAAYAQTSTTINGAGATFPFPLIDTWRVAYKKVNPNVNLNYQSIGSGGGIKQFTERTVDFGASDAPLTAAQTSALPSKAVHIPETIGSVVVIYNGIGLPSKGLKLTGPILADIYLGKIGTWDDPAIKALNPKVPLPHQSISVIRRSDGSGTTFVWTSYLSSVSPEWAQKVGKGTAVQWLVGRGAPGNEGVANFVKGSPNSIGYVELSYALTTGLPVALIQNSAGNFVEPTIDSTQAAVAAYTTPLPKGEDSWETVSLLNAPGANSYPIASFTYLLLYKEMSKSHSIDSEGKAKAIIDFISWVLTPSSQDMGKKLAYVPLPDSVRTTNQQTLASLTYNGKTLYTAPSSSSNTPQGTTTPAPAQEPAKTYDAKLKVIAGMKKSNNQMTVLLRNPSNSDASVYQFVVTLDGATVTKATAARGWTADINSDTIVFSTEDKPIMKGKFASFKITADATVSSFDWETFDAAGNSINANTSAVKVR